MVTIKPQVLLAGALNWHLPKTADGYRFHNSFSQIWSSSRKIEGFTDKEKKWIWPFQVAQKPFYHFASDDKEERMRWANLRFYDSWISEQKIPSDVNVVQSPMGSCAPLFKLASESSKKILKVFDAPNSHPKNLKKIWQTECDKYSPGYKIPISDWALDRIENELLDADLILCPSIFVYDSMISHGIPHEKCFISHFGVNTTIFKKRTGTPDGIKFVVVGSLTLRKGYQYLFRAFSKLKKIYPEAELHCIGDVRPDFKKELLKWNGLFHHYEHLKHDEVAKLLSGATAFVFPSLEEGFARVLSEAMSVGLPIITTYESGATTVIKDKVQGLIVQSGNTDDLYEKMHTVISDPELANSIGNSAHKAGAIDNNWNDYSKRLIDEFSRRINLHENH
ncbi:MAG: glycosyltransferase family 4 protein [Akkermansiaceae bacterium]